MTEIDHIALQVDDIGEAVNWFRSNTDCSIIDQYDDWAFIQFENIKLALVTRGKHPPHIAIEKDLDFVKKSGVSKEHRDGTVSTYSKLPGRNVIEWIFYPKK